MVPLLLIFCLAPSLSASARVVDMYSDYDLSNDRARYERRLNELLTYGLWAVMDGAEKQSLSGVRISTLPLKGKTPLDAFSFKTDVGVPTVVFPVLSLKFI